MNPDLEVILNGQLMIKYPRNTRLPGKQREFLDIMDIDMDKGINLNGKVINSPNNQQRTYYVALQLIHALLSNNEGLVKASCAYMVNRQPTLQLIKATEEGESTSLELVYE